MAFAAASIATGILIELPPEQGSSRLAMEPVQRSPSAGLSASSQAAVLDIFEALPQTLPQPLFADDKDKKLLRQKIFIQTFAGEFNKVICKKLVALLETDPTMQGLLGIKLEKGQTIQLKELLGKIKHVVDSEDRTIALESDFLWVERDDQIKKQGVQELEKIFSHLTILLEQFDVQIDAQAQCPEIVAKPLQEQLQKTIEEYVDSKFDLLRMIKRGAPAAGAAIFLLKLVNKFNSIGGITVIEDTIAAAARIFFA